MTTITALPRGLDGRLSLPGAGELTVLDLDFGSLATLPTSVTVGGSNGGTAALAGTAPNGVLRITSGPSSGNQGLFTLPAVDSTAYDYILFSVDLITAATAYPDEIFIGLQAGSTGGASWRRNGGTMNSRNGDTAVIAGPMLGGSGRASKITLGLLIIPSKKIVAALTNEGVNNAAIFPAFVGGSLLPGITIQANSAGAKTLDVRRIRVRAGG